MVATAKASKFVSVVASKIGKNKWIAITKSSAKPANQSVALNNEMDLSVVACVMMCVSLLMIHTCLYVKLIKNIDLIGLIEIGEESIHE